MMEKRPLTQKEVSKAYSNLQQRLLNGNAFIPDIGVMFRRERDYLDTPAPMYYRPEAFSEQEFRTFIRAIYGKAQPTFIHIRDLLNDMDPESAQSLGDKKLRYSLPSIIKAWNWLHLSIVKTRFIGSHGGGTQLVINDPERIRQIYGRELTQEDRLKLPRPPFIPIKALRRPDDSQEVIRAIENPDMFMPLVIDKIVLRGIKLPFAIAYRTTLPGCKKSTSFVYFTPFLLRLLNLPQNSSKKAQFEDCLRAQNGSELHPLMYLVLNEKGVPSYPYPSQFAYGDGEIPHMVFPLRLIGRFNNWAGMDVGRYKISGELEEHGAQSKGSAETEPVVIVNTVPRRPMLPQVPHQRPHDSSKPTALIKCLNLEPTPVDKRIVQKLDRTRTKLPLSEPTAEAAAPCQSEAVGVNSEDSSRIPRFLCVDTPGVEESYDRSSSSSSFLTGHPLKLAAGNGVSQEPD